MRRWCCSALLGAVTIVSACGGSDGDGTASLSPTTPSAPPASAEPASEPVVAPSTAPSSTPSTAPSETSVHVAELSDLASLDAIVVDNPPTSNGERPLLAWEPVDGASRYALTLAELGGTVYWAWTGTSNAVWLGGQNDEPPPDAAGPVLVEELVMRVVAFDESNAIIAASTPTPITP